MFSECQLLGDRLDLAGTPTLVEPGLKRSIKAEGDKPPLARDGLDPVVLLTKQALRRRVAGSSRSPTATEKSPALKLYRRDGSWSALSPG
jgi:hypothetical protein